MTNRVSHEKQGFAERNRVYQRKTGFIMKNRVYQRKTGFIREKQGLSEKNRVYQRILLMIKAYIPLRLKTIRVWYWRLHGHPTPQFYVAYTNMLLSKIAMNGLR